MKVLYVTNLPAPYRVDFFNELSRFCSLSVCYERKSAENRDLLWTNETTRSFHEIVCNLRPIGTDKSIGLDLIRKIREIEFDILVICGYSSPTVIALINYCIFRRIPYFIESDGGFNKKDSFCKTLIKKPMIKNAAGIFTTCGEMVQYYRSLGYKGRIIKYPFSSLRQSEIFPSPADSVQKKKIREKLSIHESNVVISIGRFSYMNGYGKGYDVLIRAAQILRKKDIGWYIIGGTPTAEFLSMVEKCNLRNIHFVEFKKKNELQEYYRAADISVLMTVADVWGLVINESMACGIPVITTHKCIAGVEMIKNDENGYLISVGDEEELASKIVKLLENRTLIEYMSANNIGKSLEWTIEKMAQKHIQAFEEFLS